MLTIKELYILPSLKYRIDGGHLRAENVFHHSESMKTITSRNHIQVVNVGLHVSKTYIVQHQHNPPPLKHWKNVFKFRTNDWGISNCNCQIMSHNFLIRKISPQGLVFSWELQNIPSLFWLSLFYRRPQASRHQITHQQNPYSLPHR